MRRALVGLLASAAVVLTGCSAETLPEVTFYADGETVTAAPYESYCNALMRDCVKSNETARLTVRRGKPVQVSVPVEVADTPWQMIAGYRDASGQNKWLTDVYTPGSQRAITVAPPSPADQLLGVEIQQLSAAYVANEKGELVLDQSGEPQLAQRGVWSLQLKPGT